MPKQPTVLLAEDEPIVAEMYRTKMEKSGLQVIVVVNGEEVLQAVKKQKPDFILLDILMPKMDGFQTLTALRQGGDVAGVPIYIFSNLTQEEDRRRAKELGADGFWVKATFTPSQCVDYIKHLIVK